MKGKYAFHYRKGLANAYVIISNISNGQQNNMTTKSIDQLCRASTTFSNHKIRKILNN